MRLVAVAVMVSLSGGCVNHSASRIVRDTGLVVAAGGLGVAVGGGLVLLGGAGGDTYDVAFFTVVGLGVGAGGLVLGLLGAIGMSIHSPDP